jgi:hypothetical protein
MAHGAVIQILVSISVETKALVAVITACQIDFTPACNRESRIIRYAEKLVS